MNLSPSCNYMAYMFSKKEMRLLGESMEAYRACLHNLFQGEVHPCIAHDQVSIESLSVLEFDQHGVALGGVEQSEGELRVKRISSITRETDRARKERTMIGDDASIGQSARRVVVCRYSVARPAVA